MESSDPYPAVTGFILRQMRVPQQDHDDCISTAWVEILEAEEPMSRTNWRRHLRHAIRNVESQCAS